MGIGTRGAVKRDDTGTEGGDTYEGLHGDQLDMEDDPFDNLDLDDDSGFDGDPTDGVTTHEPQPDVVNEEAEESAECSPQREAWRDIDPATHWSLRLGQLVKIVAKAERDEERAELRKAVKEWHGWIRSNALKGMKNAHLYSKVPTAWVPSTTLKDGDMVTADPMNLLDGYRDQFGRIWDAEADDGGDGIPLVDCTTENDCDPPPLEPLPRLEPDELRAVSATFSLGTACTFDGFRMRHFALLTDECLRALAAIFAVAEITGSFPRQLRVLPVPLLPKPKGGHRPIGIFTSPYRLWAKARRCLAQRWEDEHERGYWASGKGRSAQDAVWRQAAKAEVSAAGGRHAATLLWDGVSFFDSVDHGKLEARARKAGFPLQLLRPALAMYKAPRLVSMGGFVAKELLPRRGVVAGCGFATALIKAYCLDPFDDFISGNGNGGRRGHGGNAGDDHARCGDRHCCDSSGCSGGSAGRGGRPGEGLGTPGHAHRGPGCEVNGGGATTDFDAYIDDFGLTVQADTETAVVETMVEAQARLREIIGTDLNAEISLAKAGLVANSESLAERLRTRIGIAAGQKVNSIANLGIDHSAGKKREHRHTGGVRKKRLLGAFARRCRVAALAQALTRRQLKGIYTAAVALAADYGATVNGLADDEVRRLRQVAATAFTPRGKGRSLTMTLLLNGMPTWISELAPALQYARAVWRASAGGARQQDLSLADFARLWRELEDCGYIKGLIKKRGGGDGTHRSADADVRRWAASRGPIGAMILSLHRVGWRVRDPFNWEDDRGCKVSLITNSPALLKVLLQEATQREAQRKVARTWTEEGDPSFGETRVCTDVVAAELNSCRHLTRLERGALASTVADAVWTRTRAHRAGYKTSVACPLCGEGSDTLHHRIWMCKHTAEARRDVPKWLIEEARNAAVDERFWTSGVFPHPGDGQPPPSAVFDATCYDADGNVLKDVSEWGLEGSIYVDGSCTRCEVKEMQRAGLAVVAVDAHGRAVKTIRAVVPAPLPQTPQAAEFVAYAMAHRFMMGPCVIYSDCKNVVDSAIRGRPSMLDPCRTYAGVMRDTLKNVAQRRHLEGIFKVKAHQSIGAMADGPEKQHAQGNAMADDNAKAAVGMHPEATNAQGMAIGFYLARATLVARVTGKAMALFPPMGPRLEKVRAGAIRRKGKRRTRDNEGAEMAAELADAHSWEYRGGKWRCAKCASLHNGPELADNLRRRRCPGPRPQLDALAMEGRGHRMAFAEANVMFTICMRCGAWAARRTYSKLRRACEGPTANGRQALERLGRGLPPWAATVRTAALGRTATVIGRWTSDRGWLAAAPRDEGGANPHPADVSLASQAVTKQATEIQSGRLEDVASHHTADAQSPAIGTKLAAVMARIRDRLVAAQAADMRGWEPTSVSPRRKARRTGADDTDRVTGRNLGDGAKDCAETDGPKAPEALCGMASGSTSGCRRLSPEAGGAEGRDHKRLRSRVSRDGANEADASDGCNKRTAGEDYGGEPHGRAAAVGERAAGRGHDEEQSEAGDEPAPTTPIAEPQPQDDAGGAWLWISRGCGCNGRIHLRCTRKRVPREGRDRHVLGEGLRDDERRKLRKQEVGDVPSWTAAAAAAIVHVEREADKGNGRRQIDEVHEWQDAKRPRKRPSRPGFGDGHASDACAEQRALEPSEVDHGAGLRPYTSERGGRRGAEVDACSSACGSGKAGNEGGRSVALHAAPVHESERPGAADSGQQRDNVPPNAPPWKKRRLRWKQPQPRALVNALTPVTGSDSWP